MFSILSIHGTTAHVRRTADQYDSRDDEGYLIVGRRGTNSRAYDVQGNDLIEEWPLDEALVILASEGCGCVDRCRCAVTREQAEALLAAMEAA